MKAPNSDCNLAQRARANDAAALSTLFERLRCVQPICETMNSRLPRPLPKDDVAEAAHNAQTAIWEKLDQYTGDTRLEAWAFGFCRVELWKAVRERSRRMRVEPLPDVAEPETPEEPDDLAGVATALDAIDRRRALVIRLKHFDGLKFDEIAHHASMPENTAKTLYYRGMQDLVAILRRKTARETA